MLFFKFKKRLKNATFFKNGGQKETIKFWETKSEHSPI